MLHLHFSNRHEALERRLLDNLERHAAGVFDAEPVIVPSAGVRRALQLAIARERSICAGVEFAFLARWLWQQIGRVVPGVAAASPFAAELLGWRVWRAFGDAAWVGRQPRLAAYLGGADEAMRWELARRVGELFEQYVTYRADWLAAWRAGQSVRELAGLGEAVRGDERWQAALWGRVAGEIAERPHPGPLPHPHPLSQVEATNPGDAFVRALLGDGHVAGLPRAAHLFALPAIPPLYLPWLAALARRIELHLYVPNPCREYWFELVPPRRLAHLRARRADHGHEPGNRLLAAWGRQTQSHIDLLVEASGEHGVTDDAAFAEADGDTLLGRLQNAILELDEPAPGSIALDPDDRSIEVHVCHSLTRELEALHDHLLGRFADDPTLRPSDVLVVTPDLDAAAPLIDAVFGTVRGPRYVPYAITGRARSTVNRPAQALLALLGLAASRLPASDAFGVLQLPVVARRFGLDPGGLQQVHDWIVAAGIRWGLDAEHRAQCGVPPRAEHSFADGLQRLYAGYALPAGIDQPFAGLLPAGDAEGSAALALGSFAAFVDELGKLRARLARPQRAAEWRELLAGALDAFVAPADDDERDDLRELHADLRALADTVAAAGAGDDVLPLPALRAALERQLDDPARGGVPTGGVTFASIGSLRGLPYQLVCAIGLNDGAFPSQRRPPEFDLMAARPRRGDRQRRTDERNLFLDLLLAARGSLYLSYTGRSIRDNAPLPPSVVIAELLDVLLPAIGGDPVQTRRRLVIEHPLQAFSARAFAADADPRLRSFDGEMARALRDSLRQPGAAAADSLRQQGAAALLSPAAAFAVAGAAGDDEAPIDEPLRPFFTAPLAAPDPAWRDVSIDALVRFFCSPSGTLLERRLAIELRRPEQQLQDDEPFVGGYRERNALAARLLPALLSSPPAAELREFAAAGHELPAGPLGELQLDAELQRIAAFAERVRAATGEPPLPPQRLELTLDIGGEAWQLHGDFADLRPAGLVRWRYDELRPTDRLAAWLPHLLLCAARPAGVARCTDWHAIDATLRLAAPADAAALLRELLALYRRGLTEPLRFYPKSSWAFIDSDGNLQQALKRWTPSAEAPWAEGGKPAYRLALRGIDDPLGGDFAALAERVFGPLRTCSELR